MLHVLPSYQNGYATSGEVSRFPHLWQGLIGAWEPSFGPSSLLRDVSGHGQHGTISTTAVSPFVIQANPRLPGYGLVLDGTNDFVDLGTSGLYTFVEPKPFSVSCVFLFDGTPSFETIVARFNNTDSAKEWNVSATGSNTLAFQMNDESVAFANIRSQTVALNGGQRYSFLGTYDGSGAETGIFTYLDGKLDTSQSSGAGSYVAMEDLGEELRIGTNGDNSNDMAGAVQSVRIWNRVLGVSEARELHEDPMGMFELFPEAVGKAPVAPGGSVARSRVMIIA